MTAPPAPAVSRRGLSPAAGCLLAAALSLIPAAALFLAGVLVVQGEVGSGRDEPAGTRLWLVREPGNAGLGLSRARVVAGSLESGEACMHTTVRFLLWRADGSAQDIAFCDCLRRVDGGWSVVSPCAP